MAHLMRIYHRPSCSTAGEQIVGIELNGPSVIQGFAGSLSSRLKIRKDMPNNAAEVFNASICKLVTEGYLPKGRFYVEANGIIDWSRNMDQPQDIVVAASATHRLFATGKGPGDWLDRVVRLFQAEPHFEIYVAADRRSVVIEISEGVVCDVLRVENGLFTDELITRVEGGEVKTPFTQLAVLAIGLCLNSASNDPWSVVYQSNGDDVEVRRSDVKPDHPMFEGFDLTTFGGFNRIAIIAENLQILPKPPKLKQGLFFGKLINRGAA